MTTHLVPMFLVTSRDDHPYDTVCELQQLALKHGFSLYQDESIEPVVIPDDDEPHSILDYLKDSP